MGIDTLAGQMSALRKGQAPTKSKNNKRRPIASKLKDGAAKADTKSSADKSEVAQDDEDEEEEEEEEDDESDTEGEQEDTSETDTDTDSDGD